MAIFNAYYSKLHLAKGDEYAALLEMSKKNGFTALGDPSNAIETVEREFRRLYGTETV